MLSRNHSARFRLASSLAIFLLALCANSCGHTQAFQKPSPSSDELMKTVHDYGRDHNALLFPASSEKPTEDDGFYHAHVNNLIAQGDFAQLEKMVQQDRAEKGRLIGGYWKTFEFFGTISEPTGVGGQLKDSDYEDRIALLNKWIAAYPESATPRIALAQLYVSYAFFGRGDGLASTVSNRQWELLHDRAAKALLQLLGAAQLKERDPQWYAVLLLLAQAQGWDKAFTRDVLDQAVAFEPDYYHFYRLYSLYILPQWYGEPGEIRRLADEVSSQRGEPNGSIFYFQIMTQFACYCRQDLEEELPHMSYPKLMQGYIALSQQYGTDNLLANRFAVMAWAFNDKASVREAFTHIKWREPEVFLTQDSYDFVRQWPDSN